MVQKYNVFGTQIASHYLAMGVLATLFGGSYAALSGGKSKPVTPPINASTPDEADFIKKFMEEADSADKKAGSAKQ